MKNKLLILFAFLNITLVNAQENKTTEIPLKIDLSRYCPTKKFQYDATCYAYAFAYTALTINYCVKNNITDPEQVENNAFSPGFIASRHRQQSRFNPNCGRYGSYDVDLRIFRQDGCPKLTDFDVDCTKKIPSTVMAKAKETKLDKYAYVQEKNDTSKVAIEKIKFILAQNIPVLIVLNMTDDFHQLKRDCNEKLPIIRHGVKSKTAHDICIIGYDDDINSKYFGRFLVKNNYEPWGDTKNMAWVKYEDMMYMITHVLYFTIV